MPSRRAHLLQAPGDIEGVLARFHLARPGDQRERRVIGETDGAEIDGWLRSGHASSKAKIVPWPGAGGTMRRLPALL
jgi:hypothetical protein